MLRRLPRARYVMAQGRDSQTDMMGKWEGAPKPQGQGRVWLTSLGTAERLPEEMAFKMGEDSGPCIRACSPQSHPGRYV